MTSYSDYLRGKRVCIVGPSESLTGKGHGERIDTHDVVVRVNNELPVPASVTRHVGRKTHVLYHCLDRPSQYRVDGMIWSACGVRHLICPYPREIGWQTPLVEWYEKQWQPMLPVKCPNIPWYESIVNAIGSTRPNTGFLAICHLAAHEVASLYVTGFTFYRDGYRRTYKDQDREQALAEMEGTHDQEQQLRYFRERVWSKDKRITLDDALLAIVTNEDVCR